MSTCCSTVRCNEEQKMIVGTSTSCSASCGTRTAVRAGTSKGWILGTSITCSASSESTRKNCSMSGPLHRRKCAKFVQKRPVLMKNMYPLSSQALRPEQTQNLQKNQSVLNMQHRDSEHETARYKATGEKAQIPKCEQREQNLNRKFF